MIYFKRLPNMFRFVIYHYALALKYYIGTTRSIYKQKNKNKKTPLRDQSFPELYNSFQNLKNKGLFFCLTHPFHYFSINKARVDLLYTSLSLEFSLFYLYPKTYNHLLIVSCINLVLFQLRFKGFLFSLFVFFSFLNFFFFYIIINIFLLS
jgi:hypothetical protein